MKLKQWLWSDSWESILLRWVLGIAIVIFLLSLLSMSDHIPPSLKRQRQLQAIASRMRMIQTDAMALTLDDSTTGAGKGGYPADTGMKTNLEYIAYLVQRGAIKESQLDLFCKEGLHPKSLKDLRTEHLAIKFANVSASDPQTTLFTVTRNYRETPDSAPQVDGPSSFDYSQGVAVITIGGERGISRAQVRNENAMGTLPPREPKFLGD